MTDRPGRSETSIVISRASGFPPPPPPSRAARLTVNFVSPSARVPWTWPKDNFASARRKLPMPGTSVPRRSDRVRPLSMETVKSLALARFLKSSGASAFRRSLAAASISTVAMRWAPCPVMRASTLTCSSRPTMGMVKVPPDFRASSIAPAASLVSASSVTSDSLNRFSSPGRVNRGNCAFKDNPARTWGARPPAIALTTAAGISPDRKAVSVFGTPRRLANRAKGSSPSNDRRLRNEIPGLKTMPPPSSVFFKDCAMASGRPSIASAPVPGSAIRTAVSGNSRPARGVRFNPGR